MSIFDQEEIDDNQDFLKLLTGPGGKFDRTKYKTDEEMYQAIAKGKVYGDRTLDHKLKEFDELREDFVKANANATAAEKYEELKKLLEQRGEAPGQTPSGNTEPALDESKLDNLLDAKLAKREQEKREKANMDEVETRLKERFGENAGRVMRDKMNTLGMTAEDLKFLAKRSPEAVINALGLNAQPQETYQGAPSSNLRSDNFVPQVDIRDALFYEKMRNENSKLYFSEKMSVQRLKDMDNPDFFKRVQSRRTSL